MWFFFRVVEIARSSGEKSEAEAKALHYIVIGGRSGPWLSRSAWKYDGDSTTLAESKAAFARLHSEYRESPWAAATPYWYR
jgi:hypothetical protein